MNYHPRLLNTEMVRAVLADLKTNTRTPIKPQPPEGFYWNDESKLFEAKDTRLGLMRKSPFGSAGDTVLWVQENFRTTRTVLSGYYDHIKSALVQYQADNETIWRRIPDTHQDMPTAQAHSAFYSARFMPFWAARIFLKVKRVWVERVQEISERDCVAEGVEQWGMSANGKDKTWRVYLSNVSHLQKPTDGPGYYYRTCPKVCFRMLYDSIYENAWKDNIWNFACEFERCEK